MGTCLRNAALMLSVIGVAVSANLATRAIWCGPSHSSSAARRTATSHWRPGALQQRLRADECSSRNAIVRIAHLEVALSAALPMHRGRSGARLDCAASGDEHVSREGRADTRIQRNVVGPSQGDRGSRDLAAAPAVVLFVSIRSFRW